jgi:hypothetical protein
VTGFRWEIAHGAVTSTRLHGGTGGYTYNVGAWDLSIVQGPFSVAPYQTLALRCATFSSPYPLRLTAAALDLQPHSLPLQRASHHHPHHVGQGKGLCDDQAWATTTEYVRLRRPQGYMDSIRVSADAGLSWTPEFPLPHWDKMNLPAARNAVRNTLTRSAMHGRWFLNDPDCILLRASTRLTPAELRGILTVQAMCGGPVIVSDDMKVRKARGFDHGEIRICLSYPYADGNGEAAAAGAG